MYHVYIKCRLRLFFIESRDHPKMDSGIKTLSPHKPTKSPWGSPLQPVPTCSLSSVMDEELARTLQNEEEELLKYDDSSRTAITFFPLRKSPLASVATPTAGTEGVGSTTDSDLILAQMLQLEFDREHDRQLVAEEKQYNKQSKGKESVQ